MLELVNEYLIKNQLLHWTRRSRHESSTIKVFRAKRIGIRDTMGSGRRSPSTSPSKSRQDRNPEKRETRYTLPHTQAFSAGVSLGKPVMVELCTLVRRTRLRGKKKKKKASFRAKISKMDSLLRPSWRRRFRYPGTNLHVVAATPLSGADRNASAETFRGRGRNRGLKLKGAGNSTPSCTEDRA